MVDQFTVAFNDYDDEVGLQNFNVADLTALNFDAQETLRNAYIAALPGIIDGVVRQSTVSFKDTLSRVLPTDPNAQREKKWFVQVIDDVTGELFDTTIPTAQLSLLQNNSSYLIQNGNIVGDDTGSAITNWRNAFEAYYVTKLGNPATVFNMYFVGRNT